MRNSKLLKSCAPHYPTAVIFEVIILYPEENNIFNSFKYVLFTKEKQLVTK